MTSTFLRLRWALAGIVSVLLCWAGSPVLPVRTVLASQAAPESLTGKLLVSTEQIDTPPFARTVIFLIDHGEDGAMGLIINRPMKEVALSQLLEETDEDGEEEGSAESLMVYFGGPVEFNIGFLLHTPDLMLPASRPVTGGVAVSSDPALLKSIAAGNEPDHYLFALGYAGWAPGQLEAEIARGDWKTVDFQMDLLFAKDPDRTWELLNGHTVFRL